MKENLPQWLLNEENYTPPKDKEAFVDKSIMSILGLLARLRMQSVARPSRFQAGAGVKVAFTFFLVMLVSLSQKETFLFVVTVYLLLVLSTMQGEEILKILKMDLLIGVFTVIILLPAAFWGSFHSVTVITPKVLISVTAVGILSRTTPWHAVTRALKFFHLPDVFILVLDIAIRYISLLGEFSLQMLYSLKLRSVGRNNAKYASLSGVAGTLFLRSREMAEEMYSAMECRGFTGEYRIQGRRRFAFADLVYGLIGVGILFTFVFA